MTLVVTNKPVKVPMQAPVSSVTMKGQAMVILVAMQTPVND